MFVADQEFHSVRSWVICNSITLVVLGALGIPGIFTAISAVDFILRLGGSALSIAAGVFGVLSWRRNDLKKAFTFKNLLLATLIFESAVLLYVLAIAFAYIDYFKYFVGSLVVLSLIVVFLAFSYKNSQRYIFKLAGIFDSSTSYVHAGQPVVQASYAPPGQAGYPQQHPQGFVPLQER